MAVNKVEFGDQVVMDITDSTVSPEKLLSGETAYDRSGAKITGSLVTKDITVTPKRNTGENIATVTIDGIDQDIYALSEEEVADFLSGDQEVEGNPVTLKALIGGNAKACSVDLLPIQDLHGYDSPWVGGAGKNKLQNTATTQTVNGVTFTVNSNTSITLSGTNNRDGWTALTVGRIDVTEGMSLKASTSASATLSGTTVKGRIDGYRGNTFVDGADVLNNDATYSVPSNVDNVRYTIYVYSRYAIPTPITIYPMIRLATETDATFAPYENICPISGRDSVKVVDRGENYIEFPAINTTLRGIKYKSTENKMTIQGTATADSNPWAPSYSNRYADMRLGVFPAGHYRLKVFGFNSQLAGATGSRITFTARYSDNSLVTNNVYATGEDWIELNAINPFKCDFWINVASGDVIDCECEVLMLNYSEYEINTIQLGQTVYGGNLNVVNGGTTSTYKTIDLGDMTFTYKTDGSSFNPNYFLVTPKQTDHKPVADNKINYLCSCYKSARYYDLTRINLDGSILFSGAYNNLIIVDTRYTDAISIKTALAGQTLCYELATPEELTTQAKQISLLKGQNVISTDGDNIDITWQNIPDIEDITPIKPLDYSTSEQITGQKWIDGSDIYRRTFTGTIDSNSHGTTEIADFTDLQPIACNGWFMDTSGVGMALGYFPNSTTWSSALHIDSNHKLVLFTESALAEGTYYVTVDYIKTT